jgi:hypothetical protein
VLYVAGQPTVPPAAPLTAEVVGGELLAPGGGPLQLADEGNTVTLGTGTGFWYWTVRITGDITDSWSFMLPHSSTPVDLWSTRNTPSTGGGGVTSVNSQTGAVVLAAVDVGADASGAAASAQAAAQAYAAGLQPTTGSPLGTTVGGSGGTYSTQALLIAALLAAGGGSMGARLAPKVATLTDAATVAVNASLANDFRLTLTSAIGATRAIGAPGNAVDGQTIRFELVQPASGGPCAATWASGAGGYDFGTGTAPALSSGASAIDMAAFRYSATKGQWLSLGSATGF